jgi:hypothetical protein
VDRLKSPSSGAAGTSKKSPQVREFPGGGGNFRFDRFEHGGGDCRSWKPEREKGF